jgi:hypothetical protein
MSITSAELICYAAANRPSDDVSTTGGGIDASGAAGAPGVRPVFTQFSAPAKLSLTSDGTDTRNVTITGRDSTGAFITEVVALTSAVEVLSVNTYERILIVNIASSSATRTVTLKQGTGGSVIATIPINEVGVCAMFINSASDPSGSKVRYEKLFWKNTDSTLTLTSSTITLTTDSPDDAAHDNFFAVETSVNDTESVANRLTAPTNISAWTDLNGSVTVPSGGSGNLAAGAVIGVWIRNTLTTSASAVKGSFTTQLAGNTI